MNWELLGFIATITGIMAFFRIDAITLINFFKKLFPVKEFRQANKKNSFLNLYSTNIKSKKTQFIVASNTPATYKKT